MPGCFRLYEIRNGDDLPVFIGAAKDGDTPAVEPQETLRWPLANVSLEEWAARRIAAARVLQIVAWCGRRKPPWLRNHVPIPGRERSGGRPVEAVWGNGRVERFTSIRAAAATARKSRMALVKRILNGKPDGAGRTWRDAL
jgi:hypothetical protein